MASYPIFAAGTEQKIIAALGAGTIKYPAYVFNRDNNHFCFVDEGGILKDIVGDNPTQVEFVSELPTVDDANTETLYIYNGLVYTFDGENFKPTYQDVSADIEALSERVTALEGKPSLAFSSKELFPETGEENILYVATDEPALYLWNAESGAYDPFATSSTSSIEWIEL